MDTATLVDGQIDDGQEFIDALKQSSFHVDVACWVLSTFDEKWMVYIASPSADSVGLAETYQRVFRELGKHNFQSLRLSDIRLVRTHGPLAIEAASYRNDVVVTQFGGRKLGKLIIDDAYIYPK